MFRTLFITIGLVGVVTASASAAFERTADYARLDLLGWQVLVSSGWQNDPGGRDAALGALAQQLDHITRTVPAAAVSELRGVRIWLENAPLHDSAGQFHVSGFWLRDNGYNPSKVGSVELNRNFAAWRDSQPMMVLHELAHAWHHRKLLQQNDRIEAAFEAAKASGTYGDAYAMTNAREYFAELTEAYFGRNDYPPVDRAALEAVDPTGFALVRDLWSK
jgi:hypothetical protein